MISTKIWETPLSWHAEMFSSGYRPRLKKRACLSSLLMSREGKHATTLNSFYSFLKTDVS